MCAALTMHLVVPAGAAGSGQNCSFSTMSGSCGATIVVFGGCVPGMGTTLPAITSASTWLSAVMVGATSGEQATSAVEPLETTSTRFFPAAAAMRTEAV